MMTCVYRVRNKQTSERESRAMKNVNVSESELGLTKILKQRATVPVRYKQSTFLKADGTPRNSNISF